MGDARRRARFRKRRRVRPARRVRFVFRGAEAQVGRYVTVDESGMKRFLEVATGDPGRSGDA